jgi:hypothetical protein
VEPAAAPSYLHTRENAEEIIGRLPLVGPPVLGDWARPVDTSGTATPADDLTNAGNNNRDSNSDDNANRT